MDPEIRAVMLAYGALPRDEKVRVLASAAANLANSAEGVNFDYREILQLANDKLVTISDLQGRLARMMVSLLDNDRSRAKDGEFIAALFDAAAKREIADELAWALSKSLEEMQVHS